MLVSLTKKEEKALRELRRALDSMAFPDLVETVDLILSKIDKKREATANMAGMSAQQFITIVKEHWPIILPAHGGANATYGRLTKQLRTLAVTPDQARRLAVWLRGQKWIKDNTLESVVLRLPGWMTHALSDANAAKTKQAQTQWEDE